MTTPRGFKDRSDDSLFTLLGDVPELVRNLVTAEVDAAKAWLAKTAKDVRAGGIWAIVALFLLFWVIPILLTFAIIGLASWMPAWAAALIVVGILFVGLVVAALMAFLSFRKVTKRANPVQSVVTDVKEIRDEL